MEKKCYNLFTANQDIVAWGASLQILEFYNLRLSLLFGRVSSRGESDAVGLVLTLKTKYSRIPRDS